MDHREVPPLLLIKTFPRLKGKGNPPLLLSAVCQALGISIPFIIYFVLCKNHIGYYFSRFPRKEAGSHKKLTPGLTARKELEPTPLTSILREGNPHAQEHTARKWQLQACQTLLSPGVE